MSRISYHHPGNQIRYQQSYGMDRDKMSHIFALLDVWHMLIYCWILISLNFSHDQYRLLFLAIMVETDTSYWIEALEQYSCQEMSFLRKEQLTLHNHLSQLSLQESVPTVIVEDENPCTTDLSQSNNDVTN